MELLTLDFSTLNLERLAKLPSHERPATYQYQRGVGNGCAGAPPGFPSYFTKSVYTQYGNNPAKGAQYVIVHPELGARVLETDKTPYEGREERLRRLWVPLPLDHPRVVRWIEETYRHFKNCYDDGTKEIAILGHGKYALETFHDDPRFSDAWREQTSAEVECVNETTRELWAKVATPENHKAYRIIQRYYPDHAPDLALIENPPQRFQADWWEVLATEPTPENCPGKALTWANGERHDAGKPCRMCGYLPPTD